VVKANLEMLAVVVVCLTTITIILASCTVDGNAVRDVVHELPSVIDSLKDRPVGSSETR